MAQAEGAEPASILNERFHTKLMDFQKEGVRFGVQTKGRCLVADEMGLGKTLQAIGIAAHFQASFPCLIVVPSSVKYSWASELEKWTKIPATKIKLVRSRSDVDSLRNAQVIICTYAMFTSESTVATAIQKAGFQVVIADESHYLKNGQSQRYKLLEPVLKGCRHLILLSGTPALARPVELYSQLSALSPSLFGSYKAFTDKFCNAHKGRFGWDVSGSSNVEQLHQLLKKVMIRRLKSDVLTQLPSKIRQRVVVDVPTDKLKEMKGVISQLEELRSSMQSLLSSSSSTSHDDGGGGAGSDDDGDCPPDASELHWEQNRLLMEGYRMTGEAKLSGTTAYLDDVFKSTDDEYKVLVFAHHQAVLDGLETFVNRSKKKYIRIDGRVSANERHRLVNLFQTDSKVKVALLSMTAAGQGITLTAARLVVFSELHWTPGVLLQAEDRAHRIGQKDTVQVAYLMAEGYTLDSIVWEVIGKKTSFLGKALNGAKGSMKAELVQRGGGGRTGEEELQQFFASEQGASGGGGAHFPRGDVRSFFTKPTATTSTKAAASTAFDNAAHAARATTDSKEGGNHHPPDKTTKPDEVITIDDGDDDNDNEEEEAVLLVDSKPSRHESIAPPPPPRITTATDYQHRHQDNKKRPRASLPAAAPPSSSSSSSSKRRASTGGLPSSTTMSRFFRPPSTNTASPPPPSLQKTSASGGGMQKHTTTDPSPPRACNSRSLMVAYWDCKVCTLLNEVPINSSSSSSHGDDDKQLLQVKCLACASVPANPTIRPAAPPPAATSSSSTMAEAEASHTSTTKKRSRQDDGKDSSSRQQQQKAAAARGGGDGDGDDEPWRRNPGRPSPPPPVATTAGSSSSSASGGRVVDLTTVIEIDDDDQEEAELQVDSTTTTIKGKAPPATPAPPPPLSSPSPAAASTSTGSTNNHSSPLAAAVAADLAFSVSANTGRISVFLVSPSPASGDGDGEVRVGGDGDPILNFSTQELQDLLLPTTTQQQQSSPLPVSPSLVGTVFEPLLPLHHRHQHHAASSEHDHGRSSSADRPPPPGSSSSSAAAALRAIQSFVRQWTPLRAYEKKVLSDGRILRLPLLPHLQELDDAKKSRAPCFERYPLMETNHHRQQQQPPTTTSQVVGGNKSSQSSATAPPPPRQGQPPLPTPTTCSWCRQPLTDPILLQSLQCRRARGHVFCSYDCGLELGLRAGASNIIRRQLFALEHGVCQLCGMDAHDLYTKAKSLTPPERVQLYMRVQWSKALPDAAVIDPKEGHFYQADHEMPVAEGGGSCGLENFRTLCTPCHQKETASLRARLKASKTAAAAQGTRDIRQCFAPQPPPPQHT